MILTIWHAMEGTEYVWEKSVADDIAMPRWMWKIYSYVHASARIMCAPSIAIIM